MHPGATLKTIPILVVALALPVVAQAPPGFSALKGKNHRPVVATLRTTSNLVLIDVVVDKRGLPVRGLKQRAFHIFEDGKEQKITAFDEHSAPARPAMQSSSSLPSGTYTNIQRYPAAPALNVILLDTLNTPTDAQANAQAQLNLFLKSTRPGIPTEVYKLDSGLRLVAGFADEPAELAQSIKFADLQPQASSLYDPEGEKRRKEVIAETPAQATAQAPQLIATLKQLNSMINTGQTHDRVTLTLDAFAKLARILSTVPGRKNLIWISGSFPISTEPDTSLKDPFYAWQNFGGELTRISRQLASARVAIYPIDARGLTGLPSVNTVDHYNDASGFVDPAGQPHAAGESDDMNFLSQSSDERITMRQIAHATGGKPFVNTNAIADAIAGAEDDGANYYSLGYVPQQTKLDGKYHTVKVKIDGGSYHLAYRRGYLADSDKTATARPPAEITPFVASLMLGAPPETQIGIVARLIPAESPQAVGIVLDDQLPGAAKSAPLQHGWRSYIAALLIDPHDVVFNLADDGTRTAMVQLALIVYNRDGKPLSDVERHVNLRIPPAQLMRSMKEGVPVRLRLNLPVGFGFLRVAVHDPVTNRFGSLELPLSISAGTS